MEALVIQVEFIWLKQLLINLIEIAIDCNRGNTDMNQAQKDSVEK